MVDTDDTNDTGWPDAFGNCLTSTMVQALGYTSGFADLTSLEERSQTECIRSWRCTSTPDRRGFVEEIAECDGGAYFDDDVGLVATWHTDDTAEVCYAYWTGMVVTDCPLPANATQSVGCVANVPGPATPTVQAGVPSGPATPAQLTADHSCHAQATCDVGLGTMTVFSTSQGGDGYPEVFVYEGSKCLDGQESGAPEMRGGTSTFSGGTRTRQDIQWKGFRSVHPSLARVGRRNLVASGDGSLWVGPEATVACLDVVRTPSDACGLAP